MKVGLGARAMENGEPVTPENTTTDFILKSISYLYGVKLKPFSDKNEGMLYIFS